MKKALICLFAVIVIALSLVACGGEESIAFPNIKLTDGLGNTLFTFDNEASYTVVLSYEYEGKNVYSWETTVDDEKVVIVNDEHIDKDGLQRLVSLKAATEIEITPKDFYTKLVYEKKVYKAVKNKIPDSIPEPYKRYHSFEGYYVVIGGEEIKITDEDGKFFSVWEYDEPELTLLAKFTPQYVAIDVDLDGGELENLPTRLVIGADMSFLTIPEKEGYDFLGWFTEDGIRLTDEKGSFYAPSTLGDAYQIKSVAGNLRVSLKAAWKARKHNVSYFIDGELFAEKSVAYGDVVDKIALPYDVCSLVWKTERGYEVKTMGDSDIALYADVTLHKKGGKEIPACVSAVCDNCGVTVESVASHDFAVKADCVEKTCLRCGETFPATAEHEYEPKAICVDRKCLGCGKILKKSAEHVVDASRLPECVCVECGVDLIEEEGYYRADDKVYMGSYPYSLEIEAAQALTQSIHRPTPNNAYGWTAYDYGTTDGFANMWYKDVLFEGKKYRGVLIDNAKRENNEFQVDYTINGIYWFAYRPIVWSVSKEVNGVVSIVSDSIFDSGTYEYAQSLIENFGDYAGMAKLLSVNFAQSGRSFTLSDYAKVEGVNTESPSYWADNDVSDSNSVGVMLEAELDLYPDSNSLTFVLGEGVKAVYYRVGEVGDYKRSLQTTSVKVPDDSYVYYFLLPEDGYSCSIGKDNPRNRYLTGKDSLALSAEPNSISVSLTNGDESVTVNATYHRALTSVDVPQKTYHIFKGYYTALNGGVKVVDASGMWLNASGYVRGGLLDRDSDFTLYANWETMTYSIEYERNVPEGAKGVSGTMNKADYAMGVEYSLTNNAYSCDGWTFLGWAEAADGEVKYANKAKISTLTKENKKTVRLYAVWDIDVYNVSKYVSTNTVVRNTRKTQAYTVYNTIDSTPWNLADYAIVDWSRENNLSVASHTMRKVQGTRYNNIDICSNTKHAIFIGDKNKNYVDFRIYMCFFEASHNIKMTFVNFNFTSNEYTAIGMYLSVANIEFECIGENSISLSGEYGTAIGSYDGRAGNLTFSGSGNITITGKQEAVFCDNVVVNSNGVITFVGGKGSDGGKGTSYDRSARANPPSSGGNGGNGGNGYSALVANTFTVNSANVVSFTGGSGGSGGRGGDGQGSDQSGNTAAGTGGTGGRGGDGATPISLKGEFYNYDAGCTIILGSGSGGWGGRGGDGGHGYDANRRDIGGNGGSGGSGGHSGFAFSASEFFSQGPVNYYCGAGGAGGRGGDGGASYWDSGAQNHSGSGGNGGSGGNVNLLPYSCNVTLANSPYTGSGGWGGTAGTRYGGAPWPFGGTDKAWSTGGSGGSSGVVYSKGETIQGGNVGKAGTGAKSDGAGGAGGSAVSYTSRAIS